MDAPVSIIIPAFNELAYCRQCIQSVLMHTEEPYRLILVDNGSTDGVSEFFDEVPHATVVHNETNLGFAGGVNAGMRIAEGHVLLLNSDTIVPEGWLGRLKSALLHADDVGIVGPMSNEVSGIQLIPGLDLHDMEAINQLAHRLAKEKKGVYQDVERLVGFCMLIRREAVEAVGLFDESFGLGNFEDDDYGLRVRRAGFRLCMAEDAFVFHYGGRTFRGMGMIDEAWRDLMDRNQARFRDKWTGVAELRPEALKESNANNQAARAALEAGRIKEAVRLFTRAIQAAPEYEVNYNDLGAVLWSMGEHARAYDYFMHALQRRPSYAEARGNLIEAAKLLGKTAEAEAFLRQRNKE